MYVIILLLIKKLFFCIFLYLRRIFTIKKIVAIQMVYFQIIQCAALNIDSINQVRFSQR